jgi:hypothetical protein
MAYLSHLGGEQYCEALVIRSSSVVIATLTRDQGIGHLLRDGGIEVVFLEIGEYRIEDPLAFGIRRGPDDGRRGCSRRGS